MGTMIFLLFPLCYLAMTSHAFDSPQAYWTSKLPNTPIPQLIKDSLVTPGADLTLQPSTARKFLGSANEKATLKTIIEAYIGTHGSKRILSSISNNLEDSPIPTNPLFFYSNKQPQAMNSDDLKDSLVPINPLFFYSKLQTESKESDNLKDSPIPTNPLFFYSNKQPVGTMESNDLKDSLVPINPLFFYSKQQTESNESNNLKDFPVPTNLLFFYSNKQSETMASNDHKDSLIPMNPLFFYSKQQPENKESDNLNDSPIPTNLLFFYSNKQPETMESDGLRDSLAPINPLFFYSKQQPRSMESSDLKESSTPTNPLFFYSNEQHERVTMHNHDASESEEGHLVFVEEDLHLGKTFKLHFKKGANKSPFLPREVAVKIPFSSQTLQDTLNLVSVSPNSIQSKDISEKMAICEEPAIEGIEKQCVTSLESMVDYVMSSLGENVQTVFTKVEQDYPKMEYQITQVKRLTKNDHETIACHKMKYPYALYFCHGSLTLRPYMVTLLAKDGTQIQAIASCHKETSDPMKSFMKDVLKVMPGSTRICHIITTQDNLFWIAN